MVFDYGAIPSGQAFIKMVSPQDGLSSGGPTVPAFTTVVCDHDGLS